MFRHILGSIIPGTILLQVFTVELLLGYSVLRFFLSTTTVSTVAVVAGVTVSLSLYFSWYQVICFSLVMFRQLACAVEFVVSLVAQVVLCQLSAFSLFRLAIS